MRVLAFSTSLAAAVAVVASGAGPASAAVPAVNVGVAATANGYVMAGQPTQIAVSGVKGPAKVYRYDAGSKKWSLLGTAAAGKPLAYTFTDPGATKVKVVPKRGKAKTVVVGVYQRFGACPGSQIFSYGSLVLTGDCTYGGVKSVSASARSGCVLADVGADSRTNDALAVRVQSTGAPEVTLAVPAGSSVGQANIPVKGDAVVTGPSYGMDHWGVVWTCLSDPT